jgi:hypothetical protein
MNGIQVSTQRKERPMSEAQEQQSGRIVSEVRWGRVSAALWANPTEHGEALSVTIRRSYQHPPGTWKDVKMSVPRDQLLTVCELLREMHCKAWEYRNSRPEAEENAVG